MTKLAWGASFLSFGFNKAVGDFSFYFSYDHMGNVGVIRDRVSALLSFPFQVQFNSFPGVLEGLIYGDTRSDAVGIISQRGKITW